MLYDPKWKENKFGFDKHGYPRCPSALIRHGLECMETRLLIEAGYVPNWCDGDKCLAGCAVSGSGIDCWVDTPALCALSAFGCGNTEYGFGKLELTRPNNIPAQISVSIMENTPAFIQDMNNMADMLEAEGF